MQTIKKRQLLCLVISFLLLGNAELLAQVTIGSGTTPNKGALLDLKEDRTFTNSEQTASKGLGMPCVRLTNLKPATSAELSTSIGGSGNWDLEEHIGLLVYNTEENLCLLEFSIYKGLYVFNGNEWQYLGTEGRDDTTGGDPGSVQVYIDQRDQEEYLYRNFGDIAGDWMLENLRYDPILHPNEKFKNFNHDMGYSRTEKYFGYTSVSNGVYDPTKHPVADWDKKKQNGLLYNWLAATNGQNPAGDQEDQRQKVPFDPQNPTANIDPTPRIQGICPEGWHLPSDKEWNDLEREIAANPEKYSTYTSTSQLDISWDPNWEIEYGWRGGATEGHGKAMKNPCPPYGSTIIPNGKSRISKQGGLNILLAGMGHQSQTLDYGKEAIFWTATSEMATNAVRRYLKYDKPGQVDNNVSVKQALYSVRCRRDSK